jgi:uncharacterized protein
VRVRISWGGGAVTAILSDTPTTRKLIEVLPQTSQASTWGNEVYFEVPVQTELEDDAYTVVDAGTVCFWVQGASVAIPFGPTPISVGDECRLVTAINAIGRIEGDPTHLSSIQDGDEITVELLEST